MAAAWHARPNLGAENRRVFDACSDNAVKGKEGAFSLSASCSAQTSWGRSPFRWCLGLRELCGPGVTSAGLKDVNCTEHPVGLMWQLMQGLLCPEGL